MNDPICIEYGAQSMVSRWFNDYWTDRERKLLPWIFTLILIGLIAIGPRLLFLLLSFLPVDQLGSSGASLRSHQLLQLFASGLALVVSVGVARLVIRPSLIELTHEGIRKVWMIVGLIPIKGPLLLWSRITSVSLFREPGSADVNAYQIVFGTDNTTQALKLSIRDLDDDERRAALCNAITERCSKALIESNVFEALTPQRALSFTEIWLNALSAPPGRERLLPMTEGTLLDQRYKVVKRLGVGGQGTVYLAQDAQSGTSVVLKETILPVYADLITRKQALEAFHREAFALESVRHENIVKFLGSFVADHRAYLVLEFIDGKTLSETIAKGGTSSPQEAKSYGIQMCDVLSVLHDLEPALVHRDFTPDNLMITDKGKLVLIDFAVAVDGDRDSVDVAGKIAYMSPEQLKGKPTVQSDVYSLGCTMYYLLTGQHPEPLDECYPILVNESIPKQLNDIVTQCTKLDTNLRYANVQVVKTALQSLTLH